MYITKRQLISTMDLIKRISFIIVVSTLLFACKTDPKPDPNPVVETPITKRKVPKFEVGNAYASIEKQVSFGPRYPGTPAHRELTSLDLRPPSGNVLF